MIQRIQTVYLLLTAACAIVSLCTPVGHFHQDGVATAEFYNLWLTMANGEHVFSPWAMFVMLVLVAASALAGIFLFKRRMLQVRFTVFGGLVLIGYYAVLAVFAHIFKGRYDAEFTVNWTAAFPAVALILEYLAFRAIMKDEFIVRSLDRLR